MQVQKHLLSEAMTMFQMVVSYRHHDKESKLQTKMARLKQAKEEAEKEIAQYRAQMEAEFQRKVAESSGDSGANVKRLEQETGMKIQHLQSQAASISDDVVHMLLKHVTTVKN
ncbi:hypothetical protein COCNU_06G009030 [Cocos nucifera]|uniref:V-type proton ATPase subunit G n=1 Tax=Cocos nucifera TaxID=13894 RepID=A0A8K0IB40_COCNU|nr:hypothetical protein COCNU_06G009030 [Cocos nucifera]